MKNTRLLAIADLWAFLIHLAFSYLTQINMINDISVADVSHRFPSLFAPADITFAIWGVIYFLLLVLCIYHVFAAFKYPQPHPTNQHTHKMSTLFIFCNLATAAWLYAWTHAWLGTALALIIFQLLLLVSINGRLHIYNRSASTASKIFTQLPLSIWFGWITVAAIANTDIYLLAIHWGREGLSPERWTSILVAATIFIGLCVVFVRRNIFYGCVIIWALCGIILRQTATGEPAYKDIVTAAEAGVIILAIACIFQLARNFSFRKHHRAITRSPGAAYPPA